MSGTSLGYQIWSVQQAHEPVSDVKVIMCSVRARLRTIIVDHTPLSYYSLTILLLSFDLVICRRVLFIFGIHRIPKGQTSGMGVFRLRTEVSFRLL